MCKNDLDEIFNEYHERKKIEEEISEAKELEEQEKIELVIDKLKEIIIPVIETISKEIEVKGYKTSVSKRLENYAYPGVELSFSPIPKHEENTTYLPNSSISFVSSKSGDLTIRENIHSSKGNESDSSSFRVSIDNLTKKRVETEVIKFIKKVLESN